MCWALFDQMIEKKLKPDVVSYTAMITICGKEGGEMTSFMNR